MTNCEFGFEQIKFLCEKGNKHGMDKKGWLELYGKCKILEFQCFRSSDPIVYEVQSLIEDIEKEIL